VTPTTTVGDFGICGLLRGLARLPLIGLIFQFLLEVFGGVLGCGA
jgi:hypothetical protein